MLSKIDTSGYGPLVRHWILQLSDPCSLDDRSLGGARLLCRMRTQETTIRTFDTW